MTFKNPLVPLLGVCLLLCTSVEGQFVDRALEYGVDHHFNDTGFGSGLSLIDINGDGRDDLTLGTALGSSLAVYLQTDSGFTQMNEVSLSEVTQAIRGLNWVDYDNDGDKDLFVTYWNIFAGGGLSLYNQNEFGHFIDVTWSAGLIPANAPLYGSTWADFDNDGFLDLYVCNYSIGTFGRNPFYHNNGDGTFTEVSMSHGISDMQGFSFNSLFFDVDMDGDLDLFTSNDRGAENRLYQNLNNQSFQDISSDTEMNAVLNAMGAELGDYDNDQDFDIYVTNTTGTFQGHDGNALFRNDGPTFEWLPGNPIEHSVGTFWGCNFIDFDYDRDLDLFTVNSQRIEGGFSRYFYINDGTGEFSDYPGEEFQLNNGNHYASAQGDLNSDGYLDIVVADGTLGTSQIWIGPQTDNHWVKVHLEGTVSNRDGIGALIEVWADGMKRIDQTTCTSSHLSQDSNSYPFGLGSYPQADTLIIRWPSGIVNKVYDVPCEHRVHIVENPVQETIDCLPQIVWELNVQQGLTQDFYFSSEEELIESQWSINGEVIGLGDSLTFEFPEPGEYDICLIVSNYCTSQEWCETVVVTCSTSSPEIDWNQDQLTLTAEVLNTYDSIAWYLGEETLFTGDSLNYTFQDIGNYTICVEVYDLCGTDSLCFDVELTCPSPNAGFIYQLDGNQVQAASTSALSDTLLWTWNGTAFSGDTSTSFIAQTGQNLLCLYASNECGMDSVCSVIDISPLSIDDQQNSASLTLYPNPVRNTLVIKWACEGCNPDIMKVSDSRGRIIPLDQHIIAIEVQRMILNTAHLESGLYLLYIQFNSEDSFQLPFLKE